MTDISLTRDHAADSIAIVRLLRTNQPDLAMHILQSYGNDNDALQALLGAMAGLTSSLLTVIDNMADQLNRSADVLVPGADAVLASAAAAVVSFDPSDSK